MILTAACLFLEPAAGIAVLLPGLGVGGVFELGAGVCLTLAVASGGAAVTRRFA
jgi:hypothetical protein